MAAVAGGPRPQPPLAEPPKPARLARGPRAADLRRRLPRCCSSVGVLVYKAAFLEVLTVDPLFGLYGIVVVSYIVCRFIFSFFYRPAKDRGLEPHVAIVMPGFNEEEAIASSLRSLLALDYPAGKLELVAVNDGSTDGTLERDARRRGGERRACGSSTSRRTGASAPPWPRASAPRRAEIVAFVDSDSVLEPDALRMLVQGFARPQGRRDLRPRRRAQRARDAG